MVKVDNVPIQTSQGPPVAVPAPPEPPRPTPMLIDPLAVVPPGARPAQMYTQQQIVWSPVGAASIVPFSGSSYQTVRKALVETFGRFPIRLNQEHVAILRAMENAAGEGGAAYRVIRQALQNLPGIELRDL